MIRNRDMIEFQYRWISHLAPAALSEYKVAFEADSAQGILDEYEISQNPLRLCHFLSQVFAECGALTLTRESLNYRVSTLMRVWPKRFRTEEEALPYAHNEKALAEKVYGGRMGNVDPGDGFKFRGRGLLQITGHQAYARFGTQLGIGLENDPDLAFSAEHCLAIAAAEWAASGYHGKKCNELADEDSVVDVTYAVNGGQTGIADRRRWLRDMKSILMRPTASMEMASRAHANIVSLREDH